VRSTKTYLEGLGQKIINNAMKSSWLQRKDRFIHQPMNQLDNIYVRFFSQQRHLIQAAQIGKVTTLLEEAQKYNVSIQKITAAQKNRVVDRTLLIKTMILPIVNAYGMHHETLYVAISVFDRFLAKCFIHKLSCYNLAAAASAFIAVKYNEEFDPLSQIILNLPGLQEFTKKELLAMERKVMGVLEWDVRPLTPHVVAYRILDEMHGYFPLGFKRYLVNIVERIVLAAYSHQDVMPGWNLGRCVLSALMFAYLNTAPELAALALPAIGSVTGEIDRVPDLDARMCHHLAYLPVVYGKAIELPSPADV